jgi:hypothetical protein
VGTSKITRGQGSHNKPIGCGASGPYAPGPDDEGTKRSGARYFSQKPLAFKQISVVTYYCQLQ